MDLEVVKLLGQKGCCQGGAVPGPVCELGVYSSQEGRVSEVGGESKTPEQQRSRWRGPRLVRKGDWMTSIDLKDAYMSVPIPPPPPPPHTHTHTHRKWLRFLWKGQLYEFQYLPLVSAAPQGLHEYLEACHGSAEETGDTVHQLHSYSYYRNPREELVKIAKEVLDLLRLLGFVIHWGKSILTPCQRILFLGFVVDSRKLSLILPEDKLMRIQRDCLQMLQMPSLSLCHLARPIGRMAATSQAIFPAPLYYRKPATSEECSLSAVTILQHGTDSEFRGQTGAAMVGE